MRLSVTEARRKLAEPVRSAEVGDDVILTRHGHSVARLVLIKASMDRAARRALLDRVRASSAAKAAAGPLAERSQDFLYGDDGLPE